MWQNTKGQQDPQFSHYMYNPIEINPAYAGTKENFILLAMARMQWVGIEDSPKSQSFSLHSPIHKNMGLGFTATNDKAGPLSQTMFYWDYSYQIDIGFDSRLSFGLKAGFHIINLDLTTKEAYDPNDPYIYNLNNHFVPNAGVGLYFYTYDYYIGISAPRLLEQNFSPNASGQAVLVNHYYFMGGYVIDLDEIVKVKPSFILKYTPNAPLSFDFSANIYYERWGFGVSYRHEDAFVGFFQLFLNQQLSIGYAYDYTLSDLRHESSGSHEFMLRYDFSKRTTRCRPAKYF
jgi:type IX secretion system PorP/SprF family membrane protein